MFVLFCCGYRIVDFTHILQGYFIGSGAIMRLPHCQRSNPEGYGKISHANPLGSDDKTTTKQYGTMLIFHGKGFTKLQRFTALGMPYIYISNAHVFYYVNIDLFRFLALIYIERKQNITNLIFCEHIFCMKKIHAIYLLIYRQIKGEVETHDLQAINWIHVYHCDAERYSSIFHKWVI